LPIWIEVESSAVEVDGVSIAFSIAEAARHRFDLLDLGVDRFRSRVGNRVLEVGLDVLPVAMDCERHFLDRHQLAAARPSEPVFEMTIHDRWILQLVDAHEGLFDGPSAGGLEIGGTQEATELAPLSAGEAIGMTEPVELGSLEDVVTQGAQLSVLGPPNQVHSLVEVEGDVVLVEDDLLLGLGNEFMNGPDEGLPHVDGDALKSGAFLESERFPEGIEAFLLAVVGNVENAGAVECIDDGDVLMPTLKRCLVDAQVHERLGFTSRESAFDGALLDSRGAVPAELQSLCDRVDRRLKHPVDGERLEESREARAFLRPRNAQLLHAVSRTVEARHAGVEQGLILEGVEVAPGPLSVVMDRSSFETFRADPKLFRRQRNGDVHLTLLELELHLFNAPGRSQTEQFGVESLVVHDWLPPGTMPDENLAPPRRRSARELSHTKSGRGSCSRSIRLAPYTKIPLARSSYETPINTRIREEP